MDYKVQDDGVEVNYRGTTVFITPDVEICIGDGRYRAVRIPTDAAGQVIERTIFCTSLGPTEAIICQVQDVQITCVVLNWPLPLPGCVKSPPKIIHLWGSEIAATRLRQERDQATQATAA